MDYWEECLAESFEEHGVVVTPEQLTSITKDVAGAFENYGMAYPTPENPLKSELSDLKRELKKEREKVVCPECKGSGQDISYGPSYTAISDCSKCKGEGKVSP
ncbi:MAG: hypothetical protein WC593_15640 [Methanoregula sp.]